jgi:hypothetical protein
MATINVTELAVELDTDARTARKFLRSITPKDEQPGKGSRWSIEKREVRSMKSKFAKYAKALADAKLAKELEAQEVTETDEEPTDAELQEIADEA